MIKITFLQFIIFTIVIWNIFRQSQLHGQPYMIIDTMVVLKHISVCRQRCQLKSRVVSAIKSLFPHDWYLSCCEFTEACSHFFPYKVHRRIIKYTLVKEVPGSHLRLHRFCPQGKCKWHPKQYYFVKIWTNFNLKPSCEYVGVILI